MTPQEVQHRQFDSVKRGFDPQQVGAFLDQVAAVLGGRDRQLHEAQTEIEALSRAVADVKQNEEAFRLTMTAATEAKEEMLRRAEEDAARIEQEAKAAAEALIERARTDAADELTSLRQQVESLEAERADLEARLAATAAGAGPPLAPRGADEERPVGRPALELVVDRADGDREETEDELAARVGELRG